MTAVEIVILIAALIAAGASIVAAIQSSSTASTLQASEHDHQDRTRNDERCREFQSTFLTEIRGADLPPLAPGKGLTERLRLIDGMREVAQNCIERSFHADHTAAQLRIFCQPDVAAAAEKAVQALYHYGLSILAYLFVALEDEATDDNSAMMLEAAAAYKAAVRSMKRPPVDRHHEPPVADRPLIDPPTISGCAPPEGCTMRKPQEIPGVFCRGPYWT
jgi:hypothetical protein